MEGNCELKLINELKSVLILPPGKATVFNVLTHRISKSRLMNTVPGTTVVMVFDTDGEQCTDILMHNIKILEDYVHGVRILFLIQVNNFEDELVNATNIKRIEELTNSRTHSDFKTDFLKLNNCMSVLESHWFDIDKMWRRPPRGSFSSFEQGIVLLRKANNY